MSYLKRCEKTTGDLYTNKKRKSNEGFVIDITMPQDDIDIGPPTPLSCDVDSTFLHLEDSNFSEWFKNNHTHLYDNINDELETNFLDRIKDDSDVFINDIEENMTSIVSNVLTGSHGPHSPGGVISLLYTIIYNSVWGKNVDTPQAVTELDVGAISEKTLELINAKVEDEINEFFF
jgi:hypothetical protein